MSKFRRFSEKPLFIISLGMIGDFLIAVIVMMCIPHGNTYIFSYEIKETRHEYKINLGEKYSEEHHMYIDGKEVPTADMRHDEYEYEIDNGVLYILDGGTSGEREKIGDINSRTITLTYCVMGEDNHDTVLTCITNKTLTNIFVVGLYLGIFLLIIGIVLKFAHTKHDSQDILVEPQEFGNQ